MTELRAAAGDLKEIALKGLRLLAVQSLRLLAVQCLRLLAVQGPRLLAAELPASGPAEAEPFAHHEPSAGLVVVESSVGAGRD